MLFGHMQSNNYVQLRFVSFENFEERKKEKEKENHEKVDCRVLNVKDGKN